jgi:hypothetical protein
MLHQKVASSAPNRLLLHARMLSYHPRVTMKSTGHVQLLPGLYYHRWSGQLPSDAFLYESNPEVFFYNIACILQLNFC